MTHPPLKRRHALGCLVAATALLAPAWAAGQYPERPIRFVVAAGAGTTADMLARSYADKLKSQLGQPVVVDNKPGANTAIGADAVAKAPGDGYTIGLTSSALVINPWIGKQPFNFAKDLAPVAWTGETPYLVTVSAQLPIHNLDEFVAYAKKNPGKLGCGTYGVGSPPHLALELFKQAAGINVLHVPYKSSAQALPELLSGQLGCVVEPPPGTLPQIKSGKLRVIAHTGDRTMSAYPAAEAVGKRYPGAAVVGWQAIFAPASTPKPVLDRLRSEWVKVLANPDVEQKLRDAGFEPAKGSVDEFARILAADHEKFGRIIREAGIRFE
jgi:tripartite-type tricarboxylate transporter receptor subunit TctC